MPIRSQILFAALLSLTLTGPLSATWSIARTKTFSRMIEVILSCPLAPSPGIWRVSMTSTTSPARTKPATPVAGRLGESQGLENFVGLVLEDLRRVG